MMKRAEQLSALTSQWECADGAGGGVENDGRAL